MRAQAVIGGCLMGGGWSPGGPVKNKRRRNSPCESSKTVHYSHFHTHTRILPGLLSKTPARILQSTRHHGAIHRLYLPRHIRSGIHHDMLSAHLHYYFTEGSRDANDTISDIEHWHCENCGLPRHMHPRPPVALGMPAQQHCDSFRYRRAVFYNGFKSKVGLAAAKAAALWVNLNINGCSIVAPPAHEPGDGIFEDELLLFTVL